MKIAVIGAHGQIAMLLHPLLRCYGHEVIGIVRNPDHFSKVRDAGAKPVLCDIEKVDDVSDAIKESESVVFAAGAGPGSGAERKWSVDRDGAIKLIQAARKENVRRYIMISAMKVEKPSGNEVFQAYQKAKAEADKALRESGLDFTIIRPGRLTNGLSTGHISLAPELEKGEISRSDVAAVIAEILEVPEAAGYQWDLVSGRESIEQAVRRAVQNKS